MEKDNMVKVEKRTLSCVLTQEQKEEKGIQLVRALERKEHLERDFAEEIRRYKDAIKSAKETSIELIREEQGVIRELLPVVSTGKVFREIRCIVRYHKPDAGFKMVRREDTGEEWQEDMTEEEKESLLFFPVPKTDGETDDSSESCGNYDESEMMAEEEE